VEKFLNWNEKAEENGIAYNLLHLFFWGVALGVFLFLVYMFG
jgi:hypothetical protein